MAGAAQSNRDSLALLKLYIDWGADEAIEPTPQSRLGATVELPRIAPLPPPVQPPAARPAPGLSEAPVAARPAGPRLDPRKLGATDQSAIESARDSARSAATLEDLK